MQHKSTSQRYQGNIFFNGFQDTTIVTANLIYQQENIFASSNLDNMTAQDIDQYFCDSMKKNALDNKIKWAQTEI